MSDTWILYTSYFLSGFHLSIPMLDIILLLNLNILWPALVVFVCCILPQATFQLFHTCHVGKALMVQYSKDTH